MVQAVGGSMLNPVAMSIITTVFTAFTVTRPSSSSQTATLHGSEELLRALVCGCGHDLLGGALLDDRALHHDHDTVGDVAREPQRGSGRASCHQATGPRTRTASTAVASHTHLRVMPFSVSSVSGRLHTPPGRQARGGAMSEDPTTLFTQARRSNSRPRQLRPMARSSAWSRPSSCIKWTGSPTLRPLGRAGGCF